MLRVFLVDDHEVVRRGLVGLLEAEPELDVVGEAGSVAEAMAKIPAVTPDVVVLDDRLPDGNGIELCRDLLSCMPDLRCVIMTSSTSDDAMLHAILAGASGYFVKDIKGMPLVCAIKDVGAGRSLLDNRAATALMARLWRVTGDDDGFCGLTDRERTLLGMLSEGLPNKEIAARMLLAEEEVRQGVSRLLTKLGVTGPTRPGLSTTHSKRLVAR
ncbi:MAG TPA: response regulator transcription factor [Mycobacterium sp.]|nr:response regulator transcription factor [Mycobacterium sp.]